MRTTERSFIALLIVAALAACGGGGSSSSPSSILPGGTGNSGGGGSSVTQPTSSTQAVTLSILIPKNVTTSPQTKTRSKQYIPSNTASIQLTLLSVNGQAPSGPSPSPLPLLNLTPPSPTNPNPNCTVGTTGTSCTFQIDAPIGTDIFSAVTYSNANGTGQLGSGAIALSVAENAPNKASLTLDGPVSTVSLFGAAILSSGNPLPQPTIPPNDSSVRRAPAGQARSQARGPLGTHAPLDSVTPGPIPAALSSSRIFVIALDAAGNQIINPTTFDIPIALTLTTAGAPVTLGATYSNLSSTDTGSASTSSNGGSIVIYAPTDQVTLTLSGTTATTSPELLTPSIVASYSPQGGSGQASAPLTFSVNANPPGPLFGINAYHTSSLVVGSPGDVYAAVTNFGTGPNSGQLEVDGVITGASLNGFGTTDASFWSCSVTSSGASYGYYTCLSNSGHLLAANATEVIDVNVTATDSTVDHYVNFGYAGMNYLLETSDEVGASGSSSPSPSPSPTPSPAPISLATVAPSASYRLSQDPTWYAPPNYVYDLEVTSSTTTVTPISLAATFQGGTLGDTYDSCHTNFEDPSSFLAAGFPLTSSPSTFSFGLKQSLVGNCYFTLTDGASNVLTVLVNVNSPVITIDGKARQK